MAGNPCADDNSDFRIFIAGFLPQLIYYEYKFVDDTEKQLGIDKFRYNTIIYLYKVTTICQFPNIVKN